jgi:hypothetical protein
MHYELATRAAAQALGFIGADAKAAVPVLLDTLKRSKYIGLRESVVQALGLIQAEEQLVMPALIDALKHDVFSVGENPVRVKALVPVAFFGGYFSDQASQWVENQVVKKLFAIRVRAKK